MPRNAQDARRRLQQAALDLFAQNGFEQTTAAQIAARAGVTERTFFRHFPDKKEVLFDGQDLLGTALAEAIGNAPPDLSPLKVLHRAFASIADMLEANRPFSEPRQRIIAATPVLQERESAKHAAVTRGMAEALERRGVARQRAAIAAQAGAAVFGYALAAWFADPSMRLDAHIDRAFTELESLSSLSAGR